MKRHSGTTGYIAAWLRPSYLYLRREQGGDKAELTLCLEKTAVRRVPVRSPSLSGVDSPQLVMASLAKKVIYMLGTVGT